eukprot:COSAG01_NODE_77_length_28297_cov_104.096230_20_plen_329_part_00
MDAAALNREWAELGMPYAPYEVHEESWEDACQRLVGSSGWRHPTQDELNSGADEGLVGETVVVRGEGTGTVRQFIKSGGWGRHSAHAIDFSGYSRLYRPSDIGRRAPIQAGGVRKVKLLRKTNGETPWLRRSAHASGPEALALSTPPLPSSPASSSAAQLMAELYLQRGHTERARTVVRSALSSDPSHARLRRLAQTLEPTSSPPSPPPPAYVEPQPEPSLPPAAAADGDAPPLYTEYATDIREVLYDASAPALAPVGDVAGGLAAGRVATAVVLEMGFTLLEVERAQRERVAACSIPFTDPLALANAVINKSALPGPLQESALRARR